MSYRITGLSPEPFRHLFGLTDVQLKDHGACRHVADTDSMFPDRVEMRDAEPGETLLLVNYEHQPADTPYRASHAIFVMEHSETAYDGVGQIPDVMKRRPLSLRSFDADGMMLDGDLVDGTEAETLIERFFGDPLVAYIHAHYARRGCYAGRIDRA
jgi:hypothetical protein